MYIYQEIGYFLLFPTVFSKMTFFLYIYIRNLRLNESTYFLTGNLFWPTAPHRSRPKKKLAKEVHKRCQLIQQKIFIQNRFYTGWDKKYFFVTRRLVYLRGDNSYIYRIIAIFENTVGKRREFPISWYIYIRGSDYLFGCYS